jgi:hypothetical protein
MTCEIGRTAEEDRSSSLGEVPCQVGSYPIALKWFADSRGVMFSGYCPRARPQLFSLWSASVAPRHVCRGQRASRLSLRGASLNAPFRAIRTIVSLAYREESEISAAWLTQGRLTGYSDHQHGTAF